MKKALICSLVLASIFLVGCAETQVVGQAKIESEVLQDNAVRKDFNLKEFVSESDFVNIELRENTNPSKCEEVIDVNLKALCEQNALYNLAVSSSDPSVCAGIESSQSREICELDASQSKS
jgi:hypothetical protein